MSKIAIIGDTHIGHSKSSDIFHNYMEKSFDFMFDKFEELGVSTIIQTGDFFDYRREIHFNTLYRSENYLLNRLKDYKVFVISGNHDSLFKNTNKVNSVRLLLQHYKNIKIIDMMPATHSIDGIDFDLFPWINSSNESESVAYATNSKSKFCVGHFEFSHFPLSPGNDAEGGMDHKIFKNYTKALSGHYHTQSTRDNVQYVGTPYELTWVDCGDPKGFWIFDTETEDFTFYQNPHSLFAKIEYTDGLTVDFDSYKDKFVKVIVVQKENPKKFEAFMDRLNSIGAHDVKVIETSFVDAVSDAVGKKVDVVSTQSVIESVISNVDTGLDRVILKNKILAKYQEAMTITNSL